MNLRREINASKCEKKKGTSMATEKKKKISISCEDEYRRNDDTYLNTIKNPSRKKERRKEKQDVYTKKKETPAERPLIDFVVLHKQVICLCRHINGLQMVYCVQISSSATSFSR